jgi:hypothetical protein
MSKIVIVTLSVCGSVGEYELTAHHVWESGTLAELLAEASSPDAFMKYNYSTRWPERTRVVRVGILDNELTSPHGDQAVSQTVDVIAKLREEIRTLRSAILTLSNSTPTDWNQVSALEATKENLEATLVELSRKHLVKS